MYLSHIVETFNIFHRIKYIIILFYNNLKLEYIDITNL